MKGRLICLLGFLLVLVVCWGGVSVGVLVVLWRREGGGSFLCVFGIWFILVLYVGVRVLCL